MDRRKRRNKQETTTKQEKIVIQSIICSFIVIFMLLNKIINIEITNNLELKVKSLIVENKQEHMKTQFETLKSYFVQNTIQEENIKVEEVNNTNDKKIEQLNTVNKTEFKIDEDILDEIKK